jgi:hypothetical protein
VAQPTPSALLTTPSHSMLHNLHANVKAFGAVGDGLTDDTAAFQAAIDSGIQVVVPRPSQYYKVSNQLTITNANGLHMVGDTPSPGTGSSIRLTGFPAATDVFVLPATGFPTLRLEQLWFTATTSPPRDLFRQTVADTQGVAWSNVYIQGLSGCSLNIPADKELVRGLLYNVSTVDCDGGMYIGRCTATTLDSCRWTQSGTGSGSACDLEIVSSTGLLLNHPTFDGVNPGTMNYDRLRLTGDGVVINPYVEWGAASASGTLRDMVLVSGGAATITVIGGSGSVTPVGGGHTLTPVDCQGSIVLLNLPWGGWKGSGPTTLKARSINNLHVEGFGAATTTLDIDDASVTQCHISGAANAKRIRAIADENTTISGATPTLHGPFGVVSNGGATNMTNITPIVNGRRITLSFANANTTIKQNTGGAGAFGLVGGADHTPGTGRVLEFLGLTNIWWEIGRP